MNLGNEIIILRQVHCSGVIKLYGIYEADQYVHLVLECLRNIKLLDVIKAKMDYTEKDAAKIMKFLLKTIEFIHSKRVIHRDIKPDILFIK